MTHAAEAVGAPLGGLSNGRPLLQVVLFVSAMLLALLTLFSQTGRLRGWDVQCITGGLLDGGGRHACPSPRYQYNFTPV